MHPISDFERQEILDSINEIKTDIDLQGYGLRTGLQSTKFLTLPLSPLDSSAEGEKTLGNFSTNIAVATSEAEFIEQYAGDTNVTAGYWGRSMKASGSFLHKIQWNSRSVAVVIEAEQLAQRKYAVAPFTWNSAAHDQLKNDPKSFYEQYGSHYLSDIYFGASLFLVMIIEATELTQVTHVKGDIKAELRNASFQAGLSVALKNLKRKYNFNLGLDMTAGPKPDHAILTDPDRLVSWVLQTWAPAIKNSGDTYEYVKLYRGFWTIDDPHFGIAQPAAQPSLEDLLIADTARIATLVTEAEELDDVTRLMHTIVDDHNVQRHEGWPRNVYGTTEAEVTQLNTNIDIAKNSLDSIKTELDQKYLDHRSVDDLLPANQRALALFDYIKHMNIDDRIPVLYSDDVWLHHSSQNFIGIKSDHTYPSDESSKSKIDYLQFIPKDEQSIPFVVNNSVVHIKSPKADGIDGGQLMRKPVLRHIRYDNETNERSQWKLSCAQRGSHDFLRPHDNLEIFNVDRNLYLHPEGGLLGLTSKWFRWTVRRD